MKHTRKINHATHSKTRKSKGSSSTKRQIIVHLLEMLNTVKLYHWNTLTFSVHKATDELYGELNTLIDQFVEVLLGKHNTVSEKHKHEILNIKSLSLKIYKDNGMFSREIETYKKYLISLNSVFHQSEHSDMLNIRDEILATLNKVSYLLTLK